MQKLNKNQKNVFFLQTQKKLNICFCIRTAHNSRRKEAATHSVLKIKSIYAIPRTFFDAQNVSCDNERRRIVTKTIYKHNLTEFIS